MNKKTKNWIFIFVGIFIILSPFLGFPRTIKDTMYIFSGLAIVWITLSNGQKNNEEMIEGVDSSEVRNIRI